MIPTLNEQKDELNKIIYAGIKEILHKGLRIRTKDLGSLEDDFGLFMRALQLKNKIFDYAVLVNYNEAVNTFEGKIIYSLCNTENMGNDASEYEEVVDFNF